MPVSSPHGKHWLVPRIVQELPGTVLDVGAGEGAYAMRLSHHREGSKLVAIEVFEPYVESFGLEDLYDEVIVGDAREIDFPDADVVILGDVIEHMTLEDAKQVWEKARVAARKTVLASIPLGDWPQGAVNGNEHERHLFSWTDQLVHAVLDGIVASWTGSGIGTYAALPK